MGDQSDLGRLKANWDLVPGDPVMTQFKRSLRKHQARWRVEHQLAQGEHPPGQVNGSVLSEADGEANTNFLSPAIAAAVDHRVAEEQNERGQQLDKVRLRTHLLSSMPMCFNLFGELWDNQERLTRSGPIWGVDLTGEDVRFEWSPGRRDPTYTGDGTAFDAALFFGRPGHTTFVVGIETKYHEHATVEVTPNETSRLPRYREIVEASGAFPPDWEGRILGTALQQIWRDHLLLLALLQHPSGVWRSGKYVLVYPAANVSFERVAKRYQEVLADDSTFATMTIEDLLDTHALHEERTEEQFRERYLLAGTT